MRARLHVRWPHLCIRCIMVLRAMPSLRRHREDQVGWDMVYLSSVVHGGELLVTWVVMVSRFSGFADSLGSVRTR